MLFRELDDGDIISCERKSGKHKKRSGKVRAYAATRIKKRTA